MSWAETFMCATSLSDSRMPCTKLVRASHPAPLRRGGTDVRDRMSGWLRWVLHCIAPPISLVCRLADLVGHFTSEGRLRWDGSQHLSCWIASIPERNQPTIATGYRKARRTHLYWPLREFESPLHLRMHQNNCRTIFRA